MPIQAMNGSTHVSIPETLIPEGNKSRVSGDGVESNSGDDSFNCGCTPWSLRGLGPLGRRP